MSFNHNSGAKFQNQNNDCINYPNIGFHDRNIPTSGPNYQSPSGDFNPSTSCANSEKSDRNTSDTNKYSENSYPNICGSSSNYQNHNSVPNMPTSGLNDQNQNNYNSSPNRINQNDNENNDGTGQNKNNYSSNPSRQNQNGNQNNYGTGRNPNNYSSSSPNRQRQNGNQNNYGTGRNSNNYSSSPNRQGQNGNQNNYGTGRNPNNYSSGPNRQGQNGNKNNYGSGQNRQYYNGNRNSSGSGSNRGNYSSNRGNSAVSLYDATLYSFFDGAKHSPDYGYTDEVITYTLSNGQSKKISKSVIDIIGLIFDENEMKKIISEYGINPSWVIDDTITSDIILKALSKLSSIGISVASKVNGGGKSSNGFKMPSFKKKDPLADFVGLLRLIQEPVITTTQQIGYYSHGLNDILLIKNAFGIMSEHRRDPNYFYKYYKALQTKIRPVVKNDDEYIKIFQYLTNSHGPTHSDFNLEIVDIFKISRRGEFRKYDYFKKTLKFSKLLWYGTRATNYPSILLKGLQIEEQQAPSIGNMFGKGIYLTDCVSKAAKKCRACPNKPEGLLLLAEVALGKTLKLTKAEDVKLRNGKNSVKGLGKYEPDRNQHFLTHNNVQVPLGKLKENSSITTDLNYNEYVVYNPSQILLQYLVRVKFNFT